MNDHPCQEKLRNVTMQTSVPNITFQREQSDNVKKTLTVTMLEDPCLLESWTRVFTDESAKVQQNTEELVFTSNIQTENDKLGLRLGLRQILV